MTHGTVRPHRFYRKWFTEAIHNNWTCMPGFCARGFLSGKGWVPGLTSGDTPLKITHWCALSFAKVSSTISINIASQKPLPVGPCTPAQAKVLTPAPPAYTCLHLVPIWPYFFRTFSNKSSVTSPLPPQNWRGSCARAETTVSWSTCGRCGARLQGVAWGTTTSSTCSSPIRPPNSTVRWIVTMWWVAREPLMLHSMTDSVKPARIVRTGNTRKYWTPVSFPDPDMW